MLTLLLTLGAATGTLAQGKKVVALHSIAPVRIELPDQSIRELGPDFLARLTTELTQSGQVIVADPLAQTLHALQDSPRGDWVWPGTYLPAAEMNISVSAFHLTTGTRGTRVRYGLDERSESLPNEFPLAQGKGSWFGNTFDGRKDSRTGLDLGEGLSFDLLFAWLGLKWAWFESRMGIQVRLSSPARGFDREFEVKVRGSGYFYDVVGGYGPYSGGIRLGRTAAILEAFNRAVSATREAFLREIAPVPFAAVVDQVVAPDGPSGHKIYLLGTGHGAAVPAGFEYAGLVTPHTRLRVIRSVQSGAIAEWVSGEVEPRPGDSLIEARAAATELRALSADASGGGAPAIHEFQTPEVLLPKADYRAGDYPKISRWKAFWKSISGLLTLPYRIWRYRQYDQRFDSGRKIQTRDLAAWSKRIRGHEAMQRLRLTGSPNPPVVTPIVAVVDTGVDYNHPVLHPTIWRNPNPTPDGDEKLDATGWDFISGDRKPYDDHFHGTELAGTIVGITPSAQIMPLKAFDPWGNTTSTALAGAIRYAVDHGAHIVLCAWTSQVDSQALRSALEYARTRDTLVLQQAEIPPELGGYRIPSLEPRGAYGKVSGPTVAAGIAAGYAAHLVATRGETRGSALRELLRSIIP